MPTKTRSQHTVITYSGARAVDTLARSGLYAVHKSIDESGRYVVTESVRYTVTHTPTGFSAGEARTLKAARALAAHFHEVAGDAGSGWAFGAPLDMTSSEYARMLEAARTRPALG
jgi:hypothetical protein